MWATLQCGSEGELYSLIAWVEVLTLLLTSCVVLDKLLNPYEPQFLLLLNGENNSIQLRKVFVRV